MISKLKNIPVKKMLFIAAVMIGVLIIGMFLSVMAENNRGVVGVAERNEAGEYIVEFTEDGFHPQVININEGETVRFVNKTDKPFWPASNVHPQHDTFPEFDPLEPVEGGGSWAFTFDRAGQWEYHDHLYSWFIGRINVLNEDGTLVDSECTLENLSSGERIPGGKTQCWESLIHSALLEGGTEGAFEMFGQIYETDPEFVASDCHAHAHDVGDFAYAEWRKSGDFDDLDIPLESVYCNFGYFHGLIGHMIEENQDPEYLEDVCSYLDENYSDEIPNLMPTCYHAAGHGLTLPPTDTDEWGKPQEMINQGLEYCDRLDTERGNILQCHEGVFNVLTLWMALDEYGLTIEWDDPFRLCRNQSTPLREEACYYEFGMYLADDSKDIPAIAARYIDPIEDDRMAALVMNVLIAGQVAEFLVEDDISYLVPMCRSLDDRLFESCLGGIAGGLVAHGNPGKEHVRGFEFCTLDIMTEEEREFCHKRFFNALSWTYNEGIVADLCEQADPRYRDQCYAQ